MKITKKGVVITLGLALLISSVLLSTVVKAGFGVSPPWVINEYAVPGGHFEQTIFLVRENAAEELNIKTDRQQLGQISDWIKVKQGEEFNIPAGVQQFPVDLIVDVPKNAPYDYYEGRLFFNSVPSKKTGQITVAIGGLVTFKVTVTNKQYSDFDIVSVDIPPLEIGWPVKLVAKLKNLGNTQVRPSKVVLEIWDVYDTKKLVSADMRNFSWVAPFATGESVDQMTTPLEPGQYWGKYKIYKLDKVVKEDRVKISVYPQWTLIKKPLWMSVRDYLTASPLRLIVATFIGTIVLLVILYLLSRLLRRKKQESEQKK